MNFELIMQPPQDLPREAHWIVVRKGHVVIEAGVETLPFGETPPVDHHASTHFLGLLDGWGSSRPGDARDRRLFPTGPLEL